MITHIFNCIHPVFAYMFTHTVDRLRLAFNKPYVQTGKVTKKAAVTTH